jgi:hypothetical protein
VFEIGLKAKLLQILFNKIDASIYKDSQEGKLSFYKQVKFIQHDAIESPFLEGFVQILQKSQIVYWITCLSLMLFTFNKISVIVAGVFIVYESQPVMFILAKYRPNLALYLLFTTICVVLYPIVAIAQSTEVIRIDQRPIVETTAQALKPPPVIAAEEEEITITGTRTERSVRESPSSITVIKADDVDRGSVNNLEDLIRYEPGVSAGRDPRRFGFQDFNIRGIEGNRVLIQVDGIRQPESFSFGSTRIGRDSFDPDTLPLLR